MLTFSSELAEPATNGHWNVPGTLTVKGVSNPVTLDTVFGGVISHRGATRAGFSAWTEINRKNFGVSWSANLDSGGAIVSDNVKITLEVELVLAEG